jgi:alginate O-acetyltransferase complex protein AlgI
MGRYSPALEPPPAPIARWLQWQPSPAWLAVTLFALVAALLAMHKEAKFLYFQF